MNQERSNNTDRILIPQLKTSQTLRYTIFGGYLTLTSVFFFSLGPVPSADLISSFNYFDLLSLRRMKVCLDADHILLLL